MAPEFFLSVGAVVASVLALVVSIVRKHKVLSLSEIAIRAVAYGEQMGKTPAEKLRHAVGAAQRLDAGDNGVRDYSDAQLRVAIEAEINRAKQ
jgi:hypothetical protein